VLSEDFGRNAILEGAKMVVGERGDDMLRLFDVFWHDPYDIGQFRQWPIVGREPMMPTRDELLISPRKGRVPPQSVGASAPLTAFCSASARNGLVSNGASGAIRLTASVSL
jgi:hypothetical protein